MIKRFNLFGSAKFAALALAVTVVSGCSVFSDDDEPTFAELQPIDSKVSPRVVWDSSVGDGVGDYFSRLNPVISDGVVYAADRAGIVAAFNQQNGKRLWRVDVRKLLRDEDTSSWSWNPFSSDLPIRLSGGLATQYNRVYVGSENGDVIALNAADGQLAWHTEVGNEVLADPAVGEGRVVVHTGAGKVISLNADNGEKQWEFVQEVPALSLRGSSAPTIAAGGAIVGTNSGKATVLILENGQQAWEQRIGQATGASELERLIDVDAEPVVVGQTAYFISYNGQLAALELTSGRVIWQREYSSYQDFTIAGNRIYVTDSNSHVYALERSSGTEVWSSTELWGRNLTAPAVVGDYVVVGDFEGYFHWLNRDTGVLEGRLDLGGDGAYVGARVADGNLFIQTRDGSVVSVTQE
ncbi:outer membrane protein assembly factor BamB [Idiomarina xiamenensis]|uniref:Outer membrane protein assembly factor BamB n=1 Tax=Idiomarina xiamenensis 10-D-4 TaxID=740709 RepID=K2L642_9GAMM|nr:outer membrane protein assembly factor BamB [Idiomarina xiamenensis]EKE85225.1 outer membrane biogenesis protein BamB [Idiomarina xiamenensis 10-D-4]